MEPRRVLFDFIKGKHTPSQMLNLSKYLLSNKKEVVNWDPIYISVFPTFECNLSCDMCLTHSTKISNPFGQKPCKDMDFKLFKQVINKYKKALAVNLIGNGEPLLNKDLFRMIDYASNVMKMYTFSGSNGIILRDYISNIIHSPLTHFVISLNGHNSKEFNRMTGMPSKYFDIICDNITELVKQRNAKGSKLEILVSIILDKYNYKYIEDMIIFVETLNVDGVLLFQFLPSSASGFTAEERCLYSDNLDVLKTFNKANSMRLSTKTRIVLPPLLEKTATNRCCHVPFYNISVDGDGNIGGCCCQLLDLSENGMFYEKDAWNNKYFMEMRRRFIEPYPPLLEPCGFCYNNICHERTVSKFNPLSYLMHQLSRKF